MLLLALTVASCDHAADPIQPSTALEQAGEPQELLGILDPVLDAGDDLLGDLAGTTVTVQGIDQDGKIRSYTLVQEPILTGLVGTADQLLSSVTRLIGVTGGTLTHMDHRLVVPSGAVDLPTTFTLGVALSGFTQVDLTAMAPGNSGLMNVGEAGFNTPVRLDMTYERATNVNNPRKLVILRLNPLGMSHLHEVMPTTVDTRLERATTWLDHFSGYAMAM